MGVFVVKQRVPSTIGIRRGPPLVQPALLAVSPNTGPIAGGTAVTLTGYGFTGATASSLLQPGFTVVSDTTITGVTVPGAVGVVSATVSNSLYTSAPLTNAFTYLSGIIPVLSSFSATSGPWRATANTAIGSSFVNGVSLAVKINGVSCTSVTFVDANHITFNSPVFSANGGPYDVQVTNGDGTPSNTLTAYYSVKWDPLDSANQLDWRHVGDLANGLVASWAEKFGLRSAYTSSGSNRPTKAAAPNRVTFTSSDPDYVSNADASYMPGAFTWGVLFKLNSLPGNGGFQVLEEINTAGGGFQLSFMNLGGAYPNLSFIAGGSTAVGVAMTLDTNEHTLIITFDGSTNYATPSAYTCYLDGVAQTVTTSSAFGFTGGNTLGARTSPTNPFDGKTGDRIIHGHVFSAAEIAGEHAYLVAA